MENPIVTAARFAKKAKEILRRQKQALQRARDTIRRQAEELDVAKVLLSHRLVFDRQKGIVTMAGTSLDMAQRLKPLIMETTGLDEEGADLMALFVAGFANLHDEVTRAAVKPFITHCVQEIMAYLGRGELPDWIATEGAGDPGRAKA